MIAGLLLFLIPTTLYLVAFLYETYLSLIRLKSLDTNKVGYVTATWEVTHTLLVFAVVMLLMMFTQSIVALSSAIFVSAFIALGALTVRAVTYLYIFYARKTDRRSWVDWLFAISHLVAAVFLVNTVLRAVWFVVKNKPEANSQFLPYFIPGLVIVVAVCCLPMVMLYFGNHKSK